MLRPQPGTLESTKDGQSHSQNISQGIAGTPADIQPCAGAARVRLLPDGVGGIYRDTACDPKAGLEYEQQLFREGSKANLYPR